jgi:hypothetical protein
MVTHSIPSRTLLPQQQGCGSERICFLSEHGPTHCRSIERRRSCWRGWADGDAQNLGLLLVTFVAGDAATFVAGEPWRRLFKLPPRPSRSSEGHRVRRSDESDVGAPLRTVTGGALYARRESALLWLKVLSWSFLSSFLQRDCDCPESALLVCHDVTVLPANVQPLSSARARPLMS